VRARACVYSYQPKGWLDPHTVPASDVHTHTPMNIQAHIHKCQYSTPHTTTARHTKPGVEWGWVASSFPRLYCTQPGNDEACNISIFNNHMCRHIVSTSGDFQLFTIPRRLVRHILCLYYVFHVLVLCDMCYV
jgi:hypothetical protein